jgi:hypothetical protein
LAEVIALHLTGMDHIPVLGASGAVMAVAVLCACFYPMRQVILFFLPVPLWLLCVIFAAGDLLGVLGRGDPGVANLAHLTGAAVGLLYYLFDPRIDRLRSFLPRWRLRTRARARRPKERVIELASARSRGGEGPSRPTDSISERIDELLAKISAGGGMDSLTEEEREFLKENSGRYRSRPGSREDSP